MKLIESQTIAITKTCKIPVSEFNSEYGTNGGFINVTKGTSMDITHGALMNGMYMISVRNGSDFESFLIPEDCVELEF